MLPTVSRALRIVRRAVPGFAPRVAAQRAALPSLQAQLVFARRFQAAALQRKSADASQSAHGITRRLKQVKQIPAELCPLLVVVVIALVAAFYSMGHKLLADKTLRLTRSRKQQMSHD